MDFSRGSKLCQSNHFVAHQFECKSLRWGNVKPWSEDAVFLKNRGGGAWDVWVLGAFGVSNMF